jgi:hypothetical protein
LTLLSLLFLLYTYEQQEKSIPFLENHPMNISTKFSCNCQSGFREEDY